MTQVKRSVLLRFLFVSEGQDAADRGEPSSANPYAADTMQHAYWLDGWRAGQDTVGHAAA